MLVHVKRLKLYTEPLTDDLLTDDFDSQCDISIDAMDPNSRENIERSGMVPSQAADKVEEEEPGGPIRTVRNRKAFNFAPGMFNF